MEPQHSLFLAVAALVSTMLVVCVSANDLSTSSVPLFVFGASIVDSGENSIAMPLRSCADFDPYGSDYFGKPVGRWSNGRTFVDLISEALGYGRLAPYLKALDANFTHGVNFASSGSTAQNTTSTGTDSGGLFCLLVQVDQFRDYQNFVLSTQHGSTAKLRMKQWFSGSIYFFETGSNDYSTYAFRSDDYDPLASVLATIASMRLAFEALYGLGARTFLVMNVTPLGCSPGILNDVRGNGTWDEYNCKADWMDLVNLHNKYLIELLDDLRTSFPAAEWILFDAHSIFLDGYRNPSKYGVKYPFQACCGAGGEYNVNSEVLCGQTAKYINGTYTEWTKCEDPTLYIVWDTIHPVESFASFVAEGVLKGTHLSPSFNITERVLSVNVAKSSGNSAFLVA
eukprot:c36568_g1_i1 orf=152-1342(+)